MSEAPDHLSLAAFESLDVEGDDKDRAARLRNELAERIATRMEAEPGWSGVEAVIDELAALGHGFVLHKSSDDSRSYHQETNAGTRDFWVHASREDELVMVMALYHEKLEVTVARRRATLSPRARAEGATVDSFYETGLELVRREDAGERLTSGERLHLVLYALETGVANGGFATYVTNTAGRHLPQAAEGLATIGATDLHAIVAAVMRLIPPGLDGDALLAAIDRNAAQLGALDTRFASSKEPLALRVMEHLEAAGRAGRQRKAGPRRRR